MPGDPNACREQAARCARLAADMTDPQIKAVLLDLAQSWEELADKIEAANEIAGDLLRGATLDHSAVRGPPLAGAGRKRRRRR
jgi:hypothetical protein